MAGACPAPPLWYHRDLSRAAAEELLARAGRDGSFLLRDSESVSGAYALCVLFQKHVHTYRILPDEENFLAVQTSQGVQPKRFKTLPELIQLYLQPSQGLVTTLLFPVEREETTEERDYSDGEDEKPPLPPRTASTSSPAGSALISPDTPPDNVTASNGLSTISHEYLKSSYALDLEAVKQGANSLPHLNKTLVASCKRLHGEVDKVLCGLEILSKVFDQQSASMVSRMIQQTMSQGGDQELEHLVTKLAILKDLLSSIEKKALKALQDMSSSTPNISPLLSIRHKAIPVQTFEVKLDVYLADLTKIGKSQKYSLSVDVEGGKLVVMKKMKDAQEDWNTFTHDKIRQLIKSQRVQNKLGIVFEKEKDKSQRKDFIFASAKKREAFCQLLQLMKNKHSNQDEPDMISIFIGTWNMGGVPAPKSMGSWILSRGLGKTLDEMAVTIPHDIYVLGTQENSVCDKEWVETLRCALKDYTEIDYKPIAVQTLWNIKIVVLVKAEHENRISHVGMSSVKTGIANTLAFVSQMRTNVPSWCDRILWKSYPETHIMCNSYGCTDDIVTSDHSPVFGTFEVGVTSQFVSKKGLPKSSEQAYIEFENIEAIVKTASRTKFFIEFYSTCLEGKKPNCVCVWSSEWISVDKDETGGPKGRTLPPRAGHDYVKTSTSRKLGSADLGKVSEEGEKSVTGRHPHTHSCKEESTQNRISPRSIQEESIAEDLPEEGLWRDESSSSSLSVECNVGEWLQKLGLQRYEEGLLHNGWDDLEFLSDITEEDLEEAGVHDPAHKKILLASLKQQQQQK
ncbi:phosphatidylinositol 3,4,5-trisphosphate 5-phosphatase 2A-like [Sinocyclocheilus grahami]|uniref:phosphatidylinositol 3,4,5-trisphosphate 5-phosphatase 2A-like n=1 Tax=Sinocyclocheilus grahami TaxID=75366 RepID=UPI0007ACDDA8|nr:PREDICTED: phosphatidylinositol 3,4,5-trisphosphate 5-phosphatase 2A-like [Sinocyclocheilus grahami]